MIIESMGTWCTASLLFLIYFTCFIEMFAIWLVCVHCSGYMLDTHHHWWTLHCENEYTRCGGCYYIKSLQMLPLKAFLLASNIALHSFYTKSKTHLYFDTSIKIYVHSKRWSRCALLYNSSVVHFNFSPIFCFFSFFHPNTIFFFIWPVM